MKARSACLIVVAFIVGMWATVASAGIISSGATGALTSVAATPGSYVFTDFLAYQSNYPATVVDGTLTAPSSGTFTLVSNGARDFPPFTNTQSPPQSNLGGDG